MNQFSFTAEEQCAKRKASYDEAIKRSADKRDAIKEQLSKGEGDFDELLDDYECYKTKCWDRVQAAKSDSARYTEIYNLFNRMISTLSYELGKSNVMVAGDHIYIACAKDQSCFMLKLIAKYFDIEPAFFSFDSTLGAFDAKFKDTDWLFKIGHADDNWDVLEIETRLLTLPFNY